MTSIKIDENTILGSGGLGIVFEGFLVSDTTKAAKRSRTNVSINYDYFGTPEDTARKVAVKRIQLAHAVFGDHDDRESNLRHLDHPNVVKLLHSESDTQFRYVAY